MFLPLLLKNNQLVCLLVSIDSFLSFISLIFSLTLHSQYDKSICRLGCIISRLVTSNLYLDFFLIFIDSNHVFLSFYEEVLIF